MSDNKINITITKELPIVKSESFDGIDLEIVENFLPDFPTLNCTENSGSIYFKRYDDEGFLSQI